MRWLVPFLRKIIRWICSDKCRLCLKPWKSYTNFLQRITMSQKSKCSTPLSIWRHIFITYLKWQNVFVNFRIKITVRSKLYRKPLSCRLTPNYDVYSKVRVFNKEFLVVFGENLLVVIIFFISKYQNCVGPLQH